MLTTRPITLKQANAFVSAHHRHHKPSRGCRFCVGVVDDEGTLRGVAIVSNTRARRLHGDGLNAEVVRVATDGARNACPKLLGACRRAWFALGGAALYTYTLPCEGGASLRGAGFVVDAEVAGGGEWSREHRRRPPTAQAGEVKVRWVASNQPPKSLVSPSMM